MSNKSFPKKQRGNYLLSIGIGIMLTAILAAWAIPRIQQYLIEAKIPSVAEDTQRFISRLMINTAGTGGSPFNGLTQQYFANAVRGGSLLVETSAGGVAGEGSGGTTVRHDLGGGQTGTIVLTENGTSFTLTFNNVNTAACPGLATSMQRSVDEISINGTLVKDTDQTTKVVNTGYVTGQAAGLCNTGDENTFAFTVYQ